MSIPYERIAKPPGSAGETPALPGLLLLRRRNRIGQVPIRLQVHPVMRGTKRNHTPAALYRVADNTQLLATAVDSHAPNAPELISARIAERLRTR